MNHATAPLRSPDRSGQFLLVVCSLFLGYCVWRAFTAPWPIAAVSVVVGAVHAFVIAMILSRSIDITMLRPDDEDPGWDFVSWCGGSLSLYTPWLEVNVHYPPSWASPVVRWWANRRRIALRLLLGVASIGATVWLLLTARAMGWLS